MRPLPIVLAAAIAIVGCAHEDAVVVAAPVAAPQKAPTTSAAPRGMRDLSGVSIHMERSTCYGICPSYAVDITGDGQVTYVGREFVGARGVKKGTADPREVSQILDAVDKLRLTTLAHAPTCPTTDRDQPTVILSVRDGTATTKVTHDLGNACYPKELIELESMIDEVANTSPWVRCATGFCIK